MFIIEVTGKRNLEKYGYKVTAVNTGEKAVEIFKGDETFDLILKRNQ
jgi:CheY-like chemotaxis protein